MNLNQQDEPIHEDQNKSSAVLSISKIDDLALSLSQNELSFQSQEEDNIHISHDRKLQYSPDLNIASHDTSMNMSDLQHCDRPSGPNRTYNTIPKSIRNAIFEKLPRSTRPKLTSVFESPCNLSILSTQQLKQVFLSFRDEVDVVFAAHNEKVQCDNSSTEKVLKDLRIFQDLMSTRVSCYLDKYEHPMIEKSSIGFIQNTLSDFIDLQTKLFKESLLYMKGNVLSFDNLFQLYGIEGDISLNLNRMRLFRNECDDALEAMSVNSNTLDSVNASSSETLTKLQAKRISSLGKQDKKEFANLEVHLFDACWKQLASERNFVQIAHRYIEQASLIQSHLAHLDKRREEILKRIVLNFIEMRKRLVFEEHGLLNATEEALKGLTEWTNARWPISKIDSDGPPKVSKPIPKLVEHIWGRYGVSCCLENILQGKNSIKDYYLFLSDVLAAVKTKKKKQEQIRKQLESQSFSYKTMLLELNGYQLNKTCKFEEQVLAMQSSFQFLKRKSKHLALFIESRIHDSTKHFEAMQKEYNLSLENLKSKDGLIRAWFTSGQEDDDQTHVESLYDDKLSAEIEMQKRELALQASKNSSDALVFTCLSASEDLFFTRNKELLSFIQKFANSLVHGLCTELECKVIENPSNYPSEFDEFEQGQHFLEAGLEDLKCVKNTLERIVDIDDQFVKALSKLQRWKSHRDLYLSTADAQGVNEKLTLFKNFLEAVVGNLSQSNQECRKTITVLSKNFAIFKSQFKQSVKQYSQICKNCTIPATTSDLVRRSSLIDRIFEKKKSEKRDGSADLSILLHGMGSLMSQLIDLQMWGIEEFACTRHAMYQEILKLSNFLSDCISMDIVEKDLTRFAESKNTGEMSPFVTAKEKSNERSKSNVSFNSLDASGN